MSKNSSTMHELKKLPEKAKRAARNTYEDVEKRVSKEYQSLKRSAIDEIKNRPASYVLGSFGTGFILGRLKARPVETMLFACVSGLFMGLLCTQRGEARSSR